MVGSGAQGLLREWEEWSGMSGVARGLGGAVRVGLGLLGGRGRGLACADRRRVRSGSGRCGTVTVGPSATGLGGPVGGW